MITYHKTIWKILLAIGLGFISCHKQDEGSNIDNIEIPDNILYTDIIPDTSVTSIRGGDSIMGFPIPSDSSASIIFDIDKDNIMDIILGVYTSYYFVSASNPWANYSFGSGIVMINEKNSVAYSEFIGPCALAKAFSIDSIIFNNSSYSRNVFTYSSGSYNSPCYGNSFSGDTYYGIKISKNGGYIYGWILLSFNIGGNKLTAKEFAINKALNKPIKAGQKN